MKILITFIILLSLYYLYSTHFAPKTESYKNLNIYPSRLFFMRKFAKLKNGKVIALDINPIQPTINESKCVEKQCPPIYDNMTCYECS